MICPKHATKQLAKYRFIDLFCGIGGFRLALEKYGAKCVFSSEWDAAAATVYEKNFNEKPHGDITKIKEKFIPKHDILCAGFPCQPFSISGKQYGFNDARGTLFFEIARIVKYHRPRVAILENVKNFYTHNSGKTLERVIGVLSSMQYDVYHKILNASLYGVPQKRERIFIVAIQKRAQKIGFSFPSPQAKNICLKDILEDGVNEKYVVKRNDYMFTDKNSLPEYSLLKTAELKPLRIGKCNKGGQGERIYSVNGHAITLSAYGGGAGAKTGLYLVGDKVRKLTPRECARAMGFPDSFAIHSKDNLAYKQFGNSVVVNVVEAVVESLLNHKAL